MLKMTYEILCGGRLERRFIKYSVHDLIHSGNYLLVYNTKKKRPDFSLELVIDVREPVTSRKNVKSYSQDDSIKSECRWTKEEFKTITNYGYHKGHVVPAGNHCYNGDVHETTYKLTNIIPQFRNEDYDKLEDYVRGLAKEYPKRQVFLMTFLHYESETCNGIPVPSHILRIVFLRNKSKNQYDLEYYLFNNDNQDRVCDKDRANWSWLHKSNANKLLKKYRVELDKARAFIPSIGLPRLKNRMK